MTTDDLERQVFEELQAQRKDGQKSPHKLSDVGVLTECDITVALDISDVQLNRMVNKGEFPPPIIIARKRRWDEGVVREWLRSKGFKA